MDHSLDFTNCVALVCEAQTAVGAAIARHLAQRGAVVMVSADTADAGEAIISSHEAWRARHPGANAITFCPERGAAAVQAGLSAFGHLDILVGATPRFQTGDVAAGHGGNAKACAAVLDVAGSLGAALTHMKARDTGRIVWATSATGMFPEPGAGATALYSAAVTALLGAAALESRASRVRINALAALVADGNEALFARQPLVDRSQFSAEAVMPLLAWLCHTQCQLDGEIMSAGGGRFSRIFGATAPGYFDPALMDGAVGGMREQIMSPDGFITPRRASDELILTHV